MSIYQLDTKDIPKIFLPLKDLEERVAISSIKPDRDARSTMKNMGRFLQRQHQSGQMVGFELVYEDNETNFNFVTDAYKYDQTISRFDAEHEESGEIDPYSDSEFIEVEDGEFVNVIDFELREDFWHPILSYNNLSGRDPLDQIISEMHGRDHDLRFMFQVVAQPINENRWSGRYPLPYVIPGMMKEFWNANKRIFTGLKNGVLGMTESQNRKENIQSLFTDTFGGIKDLGMIPFNWIDGLDDSEYTKTMIDDPDLEKAITHKMNQQGYVCNIRLLCIGKNKQNIKEYSEEVKTTIERLWTKNYDSATKEEASTNQGLVGVTQSKQHSVLNESANIIARENGVDFNGRFTDRHKRYYLKKHRRKPMILTPSELAGLMHFIQDAQHPSINYA